MGSNSALERALGGLMPNPVWKQARRRLGAFWGLPLGLSPANGACAIGGALLGHRRGIAGASLGIDETASPPFASRNCRSSPSQTERQCWHIADNSEKRRVVGYAADLLFSASSRFHAVEGSPSALGGGGTSRWLRDLKRFEHEVIDLRSRGRASSVSRGSCLPVRCTGAPSDCSGVHRQKKKN